MVHSSDRQMAFELQPTLTGALLELRPLRPEDFHDLYAVASDPLIWEQHPARDRYREDVFREFFREALETGSAFVVVERKRDRIIGSSRYYLFDQQGFGQQGFDPRESVVEIGWTFLARAFWGGNYNRELKRLMLD